jgi:hypothetical protein
MAQVVLFLLFFLFQNCRIITSNPTTSFPHKINKSWGLCGWQKNWIGKGLRSTKVSGTGKPCQTRSNIEWERVKAWIGP